MVAKSRSTGKPEKTEKKLAAKARVGYGTIAQAQKVAKIAPDLGEKVKRPQGAGFDVRPDDLIDLRKERR